MAKHLECGHCGALFGYSGRGRYPKSCQDCRASSSHSVEHRKERARWAERLADAGGLPCTRCRSLVTSGQLWHLDHTEDRSGYLGVAHARCNMAAGAAKSNRLVGRGPATVTFTPPVSATPARPVPGEVKLSRNWHCPRCGPGFCSECNSRR